ncbi:MAG: hypothetical protein OEU32_04665 [Acidimicrobiia bacterium]|nr:hypothetical protein [Acidimicrobiia bacterium]
MNTTLTRRITVAILAIATTLALGAGPAAAFEPPADPTDRFTCEGGPVAGHPGHRGLSVAMGHATAPTAWSATSDTGPVTTCG